MFGAVGVFDLGGADAGLVVFERAVDHVGDLVPEHMRRPAGAVAVVVGGSVADFLGELGQGIADHVAQIGPAAHFPAVAQLLGSHAQLEPPDLGRGAVAEVQGREVVAGAGVVPNAQPAVFAGLDNLLALVVNGQLSVRYGPGAQAGDTRACGVGLGLVDAGVFLDAGAGGHDQGVAVGFEPGSQQIDGEVDAGDPALGFGVGNGEGVEAFAKVIFGPVQAARGKQEGAEIDGDAGVVLGAVFRVEEVPFRAIGPCVRREGGAACAPHGQRDGAKLKGDLGVGFGGPRFGLGQGVAEGRGNIGLDGKPQPVKARMQEVGVHLRCPSLSYSWRGVLQDPPPARPVLPLV